jgi:hypothetical protein
MESQTVKSAKIKRRNFFLYFGASLAGIFSIHKLLGRTSRSKISSKIRGNIKVTAHPQAVKRESKGEKNG